MKTRRSGSTKIWEEVSRLASKIGALLPLQRDAHMEALRRDPGINPRVLQRLERRLQRPARVEASELQPGEQVGGYTLQKRLGEGGFGVVWRAQRMGDLPSPPVALKLLREPDAESDRAREGGGRVGERDWSHQRSANL